MTSRDWVGVMTLEDEYNDELALTPVPQMSDIEAAIDAIESGGGTNYTNAIEHAGAALSILDKVQKRHIIIISDGEPGDDLWDNEVDQTGGYGGAIKTTMNNTASPVRSYPFRKAAKYRIFRRR